MAIKERRTKILLALYLLSGVDFSYILLDEKIQKIFDLSLNQKTKGTLSGMLKEELITKTVFEQKSLDKDSLYKNQQGGLLAKAFNIKPIEILIPEDPNFSIVIPKIGANAKILPNINASDENIYLNALNKGVAHTLGTAFPGEGGHIFLFAHSTDYFWNIGTYNAIFYLLYKLEKNDEVDIFYQGQRYVYRVIGREIVDPSQVQYLTRKTNREFLTLQTCWPPGTTLKRLLIFAVRVAE